MSNKSRDEARAIEASRGYSDETKSTPREKGGLRSDLEEELRRYFAGVYEAEAGLRSNFGSQLERAFDGLGYKDCKSPMMLLEEDHHGEAIWCRDDMPEPCVNFGPRGLAVTHVEAALGRLPADAVVRLDAFYTPQPNGAHAGLLGLQPYAEVALYTETVVKAARAALEIHRETETGRSAEAVSAAYQASQTRLTMWQEREQYLTDAKPPGWPLMRAYARRVLKSAGTYRPLDRSIDIKAKWAREPERDELAEALRKLVATSRHGKNDAAKVAAQRLVNKAQAEARRDLAKAQSLYSSARRAGETSRNRNELAVLRGEFSWPL